MKSFSQGDKVRWNTSQGKTSGKIVKKVTSNTTYKGLDITASSDEPRYVVQTDKSEKYAAHDPDSLERA